MVEEQVAPAQAPSDPRDVERMWEHLPAGPKATALRTLHEEQQKLVVELQRQTREKGVEIAQAIARAKAALEMQQEELKNQIVETELIPKRKELEELERRVAQENGLLTAYQKIGRGII